MSSAKWGPFCVCLLQLSLTWPLCPLPSVRWCHRSGSTSHEWPEKHAHDNSLASGRSGSNLKSVTSQPILQMSISCETALRWILRYSFDNKSTLVQVMDWCYQATSHYLSQSCPSSMLPYGVTRAQWGQLKFNCILWRRCIPQAVLSTSVGGWRYRRFLPCDPLATFTIILKNYIL